MKHAIAKAAKHISLTNGVSISKGAQITLTKGVNYKYALWHNSGIWDIPEEFVKDIEWKEESKPPKN